MTASRQKCDGTAIFHQAIDAPFEFIPGAAELPDHQAVCDTLSACLLEIVPKDVKVHVWTGNDGASFDCGTNLFAAHWIMFDLRSLLRDGWAGPDSPGDDEGRSQRRHLFAYLGALADVIGAEGR